MGVAKIDENSRASLTAVSSVDGSVIPLYCDPSTHRLLIDTAGSSNLIIGTSTITGGTNTYIEYNNSGVLGEYAVVGNATSVPLTTGLTASQIVGTDSNQNLITLTTATYPSLTELSYVKGVTSAIQTQLNGKQASGNYVTGATDGTLTLTSTTLGLNLGNVNIWTAQQRFNTNFTLFGTASSKTGGFVLFNASGSGGIQVTGANPGSTTYSLTVPAVTDTLATIGTNQTFTAVQTFNSILNANNAVTVSSNAATVPVTYRMTTITNSATASTATTITITTSGATDGQLLLVRWIDTQATQCTLTWSGTENSGATSVPAKSTGVNNSPTIVGFIFNGITSAWRCIAKDTTL